MTRYIEIIKFNVYQIHNSEEHVLMCMILIISTKYALITSNQQYLYIFMKHYHLF